MKGRLDRLPRFKLDHIMPQRPPKPCLICGTPHRNRHGYCEAHEAESGTGFKNKNNHALSGFYHTTFWRSLRRIYLNRNPLCTNCMHQSKTTPATVIDHIVPIRKGGHKTDPQNLQALCASCHNAKTGRGE